MWQVTTYEHNSTFWRKGKLVMPSCSRAFVCEKDGGKLEKVTGSQRAQQIAKRENERKSQEQNMAVGSSTAKPT